MTRSGIFATPRPEPGRLLPLAGGALVVAVALAVFLIAGWNLRGWALGAVLWGGLKAIDLLLARLRGRTASLAASGVLAFGLTFKAVAILAVLVAVAVTDAEAALAAVLVFALAYTFDLGLSLASYFGAAK